MLFRSTPTPPDASNSGNIGIYTSDPSATAEITLAPQYDRNGVTLDGFRWLDISVVITAAKRSVWWAVAFGGDAAFPEGGAVSGIMAGIAEGEIPLGSTFVRKVSEVPVRFVNDVEWPFEAEEGAGASVVFGHDPLGGRFSFELATQARRPLLDDVGEYATLSAPRLGRIGHFEREEGGGAVLDLFQQGGVDAEAEEILKGQRWLEPRRVQASLFGPPALEGARLDSGTPPTAPFGTDWAAADSLKVDATFVRPVEVIENQRGIFLAGILASLAASLLIWGLEILFGPEREPVLQLRGRNRDARPGR